MAKAHLKLPTLTQQEIEEFWSCVDKTPGQGPKGECHEWQGGRDGDDYGGVFIDGRQYKAHRIAYFLFTGEDPGTLLVCHHCDWPPCCREEHLFAGNQKTNRDDMVAKGRARFAEGDKSASRKHPESVPRGQQHWSKRHAEKVLTGEKVGGSILSPAQVREIRASYPAATGRALAVKYGVSYGTIYDLLRGKTWKHLL